MRIGNSDWGRISFAVNWLSVTSDEWVLNMVLNVFGESVAICDKEMVSLRAKHAIKEIPEVCPFYGSVGPLRRFLSRLWLT